MISLRIDGMDSLLRRLGKLGSIDKELIETTNKAIKYVHSTVPPYPPMRPRQRYVRTGTLGRSIGTEVRTLGTSIVGSIGTKVVYAPTVISEDNQGSAFVGRWWTLQGVVRKARGGIIKIYEDMLKRLVHGQ